MPCYARQGDAGMDVYAVENTLIKPRQTVVVRTGWKVALLVVMNYKFAREVVCLCKLL